MPQGVKPAQGPGGDWTTLLRVRARRRRSRSWGRPLWPLWPLWLLLGAVAPAAAEPCVSWPGEPAPLPRREDADPVRARWAELRAAELEDRARMLEAVDPVAAHRLWRRLACFEPDPGTLAAALVRTRPVRVYRPPLAREPTPVDPEAPAAAGLGAPLALGPRRVASASRASLPPEIAAARQPFLAQIDAHLDAAERAIRDARFDEALALLRESRRRLSEMRWEDDLLDRWVRAEVLVATVQVALGREDEARAAAARALASDPGLHLDTRSTSPKVLRVFEDARAAVGGTS